MLATHVTSTESTLWHVGTIGSSCCGTAVNLQLSGDRHQPGKALPIGFLLVAMCGIVAAHAAEDTDGASPFGMLPAIVIPPFEYGLDSPHRYATDLGVGWDRSMMFVWTRMQPALDVPQYQWMMERQLADTPAGMSLLANISIGNPDMDPNYTDFAVNRTSFLPRDEAAYLAFVKAVVERYDGDGTNDMPGLARPIKAWQVDNEPPHGLSGYASLLAMTYRAVKEADPDATVLFGGVGGMPPSSTYLQRFANDILPILDDVADLGSPCFDVFDFHWYGDASGDYLGMKAVVEQVNAALDKRGISPPQGCWITEMSTYSGDPKPLVVLDSVDYPFQSERQQAVDLVRRNVYALSLGVRKVFMAYGITEGFKHDEGYFDFTGLVYDGRYANDCGKGVKKLSYYTYKKMSEMLSDSKERRFVPHVDSNGLHVISRASAEGQLWIVWADHPPASVVLTLSPGTTGVTVTASVPLAPDGASVPEYGTAFAVSTMAIPETVPPQAMIELFNETPLYVQEHPGRK